VVNALATHAATHSIALRFRNKEQQVHRAAAAGTADAGAGAAAAPPLPEGSAGGSGDTPSYLRMLVPTLLRFVQTEVPDRLRPELDEGNQVSQMLAASLLEAVLLRTRTPWGDGHELLDLQSATLARLHRCVLHGPAQLQLPLLRLLRLVVLRRHQAPPAAHTDSEGGSEAATGAWRGAAPASFDAKDVTVSHPIGAARPAGERRRWGVSLQGAYAQRTCLAAMPAHCPGADPLLLACILQGLTKAPDVVTRSLWVDWLVAMLPWLRPFMKVLVASSLCADCAHGRRAGLNLCCGGCVAYGVAPARRSRL